MLSQTAMFNKLIPVPAMISIYLGWWVYAGFGPKVRGLPSAERLLPLPKATTTTTTTTTAAGLSPDLPSLQLRLQVWTPGGEQSLQWGLGQNICQRNECSEQLHSAGDMTIYRVSAPAFCVDILLSVWLWEHRVSILQSDVVHPDEWWNLILQNITSPNRMISIQQFLLSRIILKHDNDCIVLYLSSIINN